MYSIKYPAARPQDVVDDLYGHQVADPYRWLENPDDPATRRWLSAQRALAASYAERLDHRARFQDMFSSLIAGPTASPVKPAGRRRFRVGRPGSSGEWSVEVADEPDAPWRTLLGRAQLGSDAAIRRWQPSPSGRFLAVQTIIAGAEDHTPLSIVDVESGDVVESSALTRYSPVAWRADEHSFHYVRRHLGEPGWGVYRHQLGTPVEQDELLIGNSHPVGRYHLVLWHDRWLVISGRVGTGASDVLKIADLAGDGTAIDVPLAGCSASAVVVDRSGKVIAISTADAEFGEVVALSRSDSGWNPPERLIASRPPTVLVSISLVDLGGRDALVVLASSDGYSEMSIHDAGTGGKHCDVTLPGAGTVSGIGPGIEPGTLTLSYTDWITPLSVWRLHLASGTVEPTSADVIRRDEVETTRTTFRSLDGTEVPMTILTPRGRGSGPQPTILSCYGGFGISFTPSFEPDGLTWVLLGGTLAIASVRGGGERGRGWHRAGMGAGKIKVLEDLHAAGDWLVDEGWTTRDCLALLGGSNGGMIVSAAAVQRPAAYAAVAIAGAPLDMVRYEQWGLGPAWRAEYGSAADPAALAWLLAYSPYHNVRPSAGRFPAMWFYAAANDTRVDPLHSRKMVARLQNSTSGGPVLLTIADGAGHSDGGPDAIGNAMAMLAFLAAHTGLTVST